MRKVTDTEKHIILGSASPRRRELLSELGFEFEVDTENSFEEKFDPQTPHCFPKENLTDSTVRSQKTKSS